MAIFFFLKYGYCSVPAHSIFKLTHTFQKVPKTWVFEEVERHPLPLQGQSLLPATRGSEFMQPIAGPNCPLTQCRPLAREANSHIWERRANLIFTNKEKAFPDAHPQYNNCHKDAVGRILKVLQVRVIHGKGSTHKRGMSNLHHFHHSLFKPIDRIYGCGFAASGCFPLKSIKLSMCIHEQPDRQKLDTTSYMAYMSSWRWRKRRQGKVKWIQASTSAVYYFHIVQVWLRRIQQAILHVMQEQAPSGCIQDSSMLPCPSIMMGHYALYAATCLNFIYMSREHKDTVWKGLTSVFWKKCQGHCSNDMNKECFSHVTQNRKDGFCWLKTYVKKT